MRVYSRLPAVLSLLALACGDADGGSTPKPPSGGAIDPISADAGPVDGGDLPPDRDGEAPQAVEQNECETGVHTCDADPVACIDLFASEGGYACLCPVGYEGDGVGDEGCRPVRPAEVDECAAGDHDCDGDPQACVDLANGAGGFACVCPEGFVGDGRGEQGCERESPPEVDECATGEHDCDDLPAACVDLPNDEGRYTCRCPDGYQGDGRGPGGCERRPVDETDECATGQHDCQSGLAVCIDLGSESGRYSCQCPYGYVGNGRGPNGCRDVDECATGPCESWQPLCVNEPGSYHCESCPSGLYSSTQDGRTTCVPGLRYVEVRGATLSPEFETTRFDYTLEPERGTDTFVMEVDHASNLTVTLDGSPVARDQTITIPTRREARTLVVEVSAGSARSTYRLQVRPVVPIEGAPAVRLAPDPRQRAMTFGWSVAAEGDTLVVGAPGENVDHRGTSVRASGAVYVYRREQGGFRQTQKLTVPVPAFADQFGTSLALREGSLVVGSPGGGDSAVYLFRDGAAGFILADKLEAPPLLSGGFGAAVAFDGQTVVVGAPSYRPERGADGTNLVRAGTAFAFHVEEGRATYEQELPHSLEDLAEFGRGVAVAGDAISVITRLGRMHVYRRAAGAWTQSQTITSTQPDGPFLTGAAVAMEGDTLVTSCRVADQDGEEMNGCVQVYRLAAGEFRVERTLSATALDTQATFGSSLALSSDALAVGVVPYSPLSGWNREGYTPAAYRFPRDARGGFDAPSALYPADQVTAFRYGGIVAVSSRGCFVGAPYAPATPDEPAAERAGLLYAFE